MQTMNHASRFVRLLAKKKIFMQSPLTVAEIGIIGEPASFWSQWGLGLHLHCFEAPSACRNAPLTKTDGHPIALHRHPAVEDSTPVFKRLATAVPGTVDFLRMDMRDSGISALTELEAFLPHSDLLGLDIYFMFNSAPGVPSLTDIEAMLKPRGYRLYDMELVRSSYEALHYPVAWDHRDAMGNPIFGPTTHGPLSYGRAVFFKDIDSDEFLSSYQNKRYVVTLLKFASLLLLYNLADCAAKVLAEHHYFINSLLPVEDLLDLMVPDYFGTGLSYQEYREAYIRQTGRPAGKAKILPFWKRKIG